MHTSISLCISHSSKTLTPDLVKYSTSPLWACCFVQDEALDSEGPHRAFEEMAKEVNDLAAVAAAKGGPGAKPVTLKIADDVSYFGLFPSQFVFVGVSPYLQSDGTVC